MRGTFAGCCASAWTLSAMSMAQSIGRKTFFLMSFLPRFFLRSAFAPCALLSHLITLSARAGRFSGIVTPIALTK
jgi:hypothetical protein